MSSVPAEAARASTSCRRASARRSGAPLTATSSSTTSPSRVHKDDAFLIEDQGSLNGTFLNRRRIESGRLENGDELQIGKYKLSFLEK